MADTWRERFDELERRVGDGVLQGQIIVDQAYAAYQHVHEHLRHPRGGGPHFVSQPLLSRYRQHVRNLADGVLDGTLVEKMAENMEDMSDQVSVLAPVDKTPLRNSGHPVVHDNGMVVYDRPPRAPRIHK